MYCIHVYLKCSLIERKYMKDRKKGINKNIMDGHKLKRSKNG